MICQKKTRKSSEVSSNCVTLWINHNGHRGTTVLCQTIRKRVKKQWPRTIRILLFPNTGPIRSKLSYETCYFLAPQCKMTNTIKKNCWKWKQILTKWRRLHLLWDATRKACGACRWRLNGGPFPDQISAKPSAISLPISWHFSTAVIYRYPFGISFEVYCRKERKFILKSIVVLRVKISM